MAISSSRIFSLTNTSTCVIVRGKNDGKVYAHIFSTKKYMWFFLSVKGDEISRGGYRLYSNMAERKLHCPC